MTIVLQGAAVSFSSPDTAVETLLEDEDFIASNTMYSINGAMAACCAQLHSNCPRLTGSVRPLLLAEDDECSSAATTDSR